MRTAILLALLPLTIGCTSGGGGGSGTNPLGQAQIDEFVSAHDKARGGCA